MEKRRGERETCKVRVKKEAASFTSNKRAQARFMATLTKKKTGRENLDQRGWEKEKKAAGGRTCRKGEKGMIRPPD